MKDVMYEKIRNHIRNLGVLETPLGQGILDRTLGKTYGRSVVLTLRPKKDFEKGVFLREIKGLQDYEIRNYSETDGKTIITLASRGECLTEQGIGKEVTEADELRIGKIIGEFEGLVLESIVFDSAPSSFYYKKYFGLK